MSKTLNAIIQQISDIPAPFSEIASLKSAVMELALYIKDSESSEEQA